MTAGRRIGELLQGAGLVTEQQLFDSLEEQKLAGGRLGEILVAKGFVTELQVTQVLSNQLSVAWVSLAHVEFSRELLSLVPKMVAEQHTLLPVHFRVGDRRQKILYVAMDDPTDVPAMEHVSRLAGMHVRPLIAPPSDIRREIRDRYQELLG
jgi:type IV pilus assembly protein PilB